MKNSSIIGRYTVTNVTVNDLEILKIIKSKGIAFSISYGIEGMKELAAIANCIDTNFWNPELQAVPSLEESAEVIKEIYPDFEIVRK